MVLTLVLSAGLLVAAGPDDQYIDIYTLIREADGLAASEPQSALEKYVQAQTFLQRFQKGNPNWNAAVVRFRLAYLGQQISNLTGKARPESAATAAQKAAGQDTNATPVIDAALRAELETLRARNNQLEADKALLEAKLREALSAMPRTADPKELARAEERIRSLEKENELFKVSRDNARADKAKPAENPVLKQREAELAELNKSLAAETERVRQLQAENLAIKKRLESAGNAPAAELVTIQKALDSASTELQQQKQLAARLALEKENLVSRVASLQAEVEKTSGLRQANEKQLERIRELENEISRQSKLATRESGTRRERSLARQVAELESKVSAYQTRVAVLQAKPIPLKPEELALFKTPAPSLPTRPARGFLRARKEQGISANMMAEASKQFADKQYEKAEATLKQTTSQSQPNVEALTQLAATQLAQERLPEADATVKQALAVAPDDAVTLQMAGMLRYKQGNMDEAAGYLSRASKLNPKNAETFNYLGLALSHQGMRAAAETALRKALELQPGYGSAHHNLAVIYLSQQPPSVELARWHYQKALAAGHPRNADLEKTLESRAAKP